jgi:hypothetical protein
VIPLHKEGSAIRANVPGPARPRPTESRRMRGLLLRDIIIDRMPSRHLQVVRVFKNGLRWLRGKGSNLDSQGQNLLSYL